MEKGEVTKEFPEGKEKYCPRCYFENDKVILRKDCEHNKCCDRYNGDLDITGSCIFCKKYLGKSVHNPCPYGNDDCPICKK